MTKRIRNGAVFFPVVLAVAVAGCSLAPRYERPEPLEMPDGFVADASSAEQEIPEVSSGWWIGLGDAGLDSMVTAALRNSPTLHAAVASVLDFRARAGGAGAAMWPSIMIGGSAGKSKMSLGQFGMPGSIENTQYSYSASTAYEIDLWRRLADTRKAARVSLAASEEDLRVVRRTLAADVVRAWLRVRELDEKYQIELRTLRNSENNLRLVEDRYTGGLASSAQLYAARQSAASAGTSELRQKHELAAASRSLEILCGVYPAGIAAVSSAAAALADLPPLPAVPASLPSELLERRPDIRAAELRLIAAYASVGVARTAYFPSFTLSGEAGGRNAVFDMLLEDISSVWSVAAGVAMPLVNRGAARAGVESAHAAVEAAKAGYERALLLALLEVENALDLESSLGERRRLARESAGAAGAAHGLSLERYSQGVDPFSAALEAERRSLQAEADLVTVEAACRVARVNLILALGGDWDIESPA